MIIRDVEELAVSVRGARRELGLTQQELAELSGVSVRAISALEAGESAITFNRLLAILSVVGLSLSLEVKRID